MVVSLPVVPHGGALRHRLGIGQGDHQPLLLPPGGAEQQLHRVHGLAHIAPAGGGNVFPHAILAVHLRAQALPHEPDTPVDGGQHVGGLDGLEFKHGRPAEHRIIHVKIGVLRGGGDQGDLAILHKFQQRLLLLLVEVLNLVQIEQHPIGGQHGADVLDDVLDIRDGGRGGVEPVEGPVGAPGDDVGHRGFAGTGGAIKDQVGDVSALDDAAQQAVFPQNMALPHHLVQALGADLVGQGPV